MKFLQNSLALWENCMKFYYVIRIPLNFSKLHEISESLATLLFREFCQAKFSFLFLGTSPSVIILPKILHEPIKETRVRRNWFATWANGCCWDPTWVDGKIPRKRTNPMFRSANVRSVTRSGSHASQTTGCRSEKTMH